MEGQLARPLLCRTLSSDRTSLTLDDHTTYTIARKDPTRFIPGLPHQVTLDEVQRVPDQQLTAGMQQTQQTPSESHNPG